jgi:4a-hydroxytetrahydrobiopterin dehydratase
MPALTAEDIQAKLPDTAGWELFESSLRRAYKFKDFIESMTFVLKVAFLAEQADHHPDIFINYSRVTLTLSTHSESGITEKDFALAKQINGIESPLPQQ